MLFFIAFRKHFITVIGICSRALNISQNQIVEIPIDAYYVRPNWYKGLIAVLALTFSIFNFIFLEYKREKIKTVSVSISLIPTKIERDKYLRLN